MIHNQDTVKQQGAYGPGEGGVVSVDMRYNRGCAAKMGHILTPLVNLIFGKCMGHISFQLLFFAKCGVGGWDRVGGLPQILAKAHPPPHPGTSNIYHT